MTAAKSFWSGAALCAYTYIGYPAIVSAWAALRQRRTAPDVADPQSHRPTVTVIVAAHREGAVIEDRLENLLDSDYPEDLLDVIVAVDDDATTAGVVASVAARTPRVRLIESSTRQGKSRAITRAAAAARGEVLVFSDANNSYSADAIALLVQPFADPTVGAVTGAKRSGEGGIAGEGAYWRYEHRIRVAESAIGCCTGVNGEIIAVRSTAFVPIPDDVINDDFWMAMQVTRAGYDVRYAPGAISTEPATRDLAEDAVRRRRMVAGRCQALCRARESLPLRRPLVMWQIVSHKVLRLLVPVGFLVAGAGAVTAAFRPGRRRGLRSLGPPWGALISVAMTAGSVIAVVGEVRLRAGRAVPSWNRLLAFVWATNRSQLEGAYLWFAGRADVRWERVDRDRVGAGSPPSEEIAVDG